MIYGNEALLLVNSERRSNLYVYRASAGPSCCPLFAPSTGHGLFENAGCPASYRQFRQCPNAHVCPLVLPGAVSAVGKQVGLTLEQVKAVLEQHPELYSARVRQALTWAGTACSNES
jgi:hypothetical protein